MSSTNEGKNRGVIIQIIFFVTGLILLVQAMRLQILDDTYARRAEATTIDQFTLYPSRGLIYDRNGELLVNNNLVYDLLVTYNQIDASMDTLKFCELLGIERADFERRLKKNWSDVRYSKRKPFVFMSTISAESFTKFQESLYEFPGFFAQRRNVRGYPYPNAAHILGFIREVDQRELEANEEIYSLGDYIGGSGLEQMYEDALRGEKGARFVLQDNQGNEIEEYKSGELNKNAVSGADLTTTLDIELQAYVEELMENKIGGVVVLEAKTGEVLAMASMPDYDPNLLTINRNRGKAVQELSRDSLKPFFNRALMAQYPPGSIFKPVVGLIAMEEGVSQPKRQIYCPGFYAYNGFTWGCRAHPLPRNVGVGIQYSCNTYFFQTFRDIIDKESFYKPEVGLDLFVDHLQQFGLGDSLRIDLPGEEEGHIPTSRYYDRKYPKERGGWKSPTIISVGIGQGELLLTTLQMANMAAVIANRGWYYLPHLGKSFSDPSFKIPSRFIERQEVNIAKEHFEPIIEGMERVVDSGTGRGAFVPGVRVAGKTGTVQNPHGMDHSTFIGFGPVEDPEIVVAVYVESAGGGGRFAAPIAGLIIEKYLSEDGTIHPSKNWLEQNMKLADLVNRP